MMPCEVIHTLQYDLYSEAGGEQGRALPVV